MAPLLENKVAIVTGAAQGIGLAIATRFAAEGARVVLADIDIDAATRSAAELGTDRAFAERCDVTSESDVGNLVDVTVQRFGSLDIMVNNAGITRDASMASCPWPTFGCARRALAGTWLGTKVAGGVMRAQGSGGDRQHVLHPGKVGNFGQTNYSAAKAGIVALTKAAAKELARHGVRVNAIAPGLIRTAMTEAMPQSAWDAKMAEIPMGRAGEPAEVAAVATFLAPTWPAT